MNHQLTEIKQGITPNHRKAITGDLLHRYVTFLDAKPRTVETYGKALRQLWGYLQEQNIPYPEREDILAYRDSLRERGYKPSTIQSYITAARLFFRWTAQEGFYPNIAEHMKGATIDKSHKKDYLTSAQAKDLLDSIERDTLKGLRDYAMLALMITGGLRAIEVQRANIGDLRAAGNMVVLYVQGKGRDEKSEYVKVSEPVERAIRDYLTARGKRPDTAPLFASLSNNNKGERLTTRSISGTVKQRMQRAGFDSDRLTAHSLRHTAVTLSLLAGQDLAEVQQFARHSNIATTMIYNHALEKAKNGCSEAITSALWG